jgi:hypothetical protein
MSQSSSRSFHPSKLMRLALLSGGLWLACAMAQAQTAMPGKPYEGLPEKLGTVDFPISCNAAAQTHFTRGIALYHSYHWPEARKAFAATAQADPTCAMAPWGQAIVEIGNAFTWPLRGKALAEGAQAIAQAKALAPKTQRERDYVAAVEAFFADADKVPARTRQLAYELALEKMTRDYPRDIEAVVFHAHVMSANFDPSDKKYTNQLKAADVLERLYVTLPDHPGVAHYLIHTYDFPPLAQRALKAAQRYRTIAASAPHALHMPSHTFTRLGHWQDSLSSNLAVLKIQPDIVNRLHSLDYMVYAYLQLGQDRAAQQVLADLRASQSRIEGDTLFAAAFALAAIPARLTTERGQWAEAAKLALTPDELAFNWQQFPHAQAVLVYARGLGAARSGDAAGARREVATLQRLKQAMLDGGLRYWADQAEIQTRAVEAWALRAEGKDDEALKMMRAAADHEDTTDKAAVTPGPIKPAREMLGEMLAQARQPAAALVEFEAAMGKEPGRMRTALGAAQAAAAAGERARARTHFAQVAKLLEAADAEHPELGRVRAQLAAL